MVDPLVDSTGLSPLLAQVLAQRGVVTPNQATDYLNPERLQLPSPLVEFPDLAASLELLVEAIQGGKSIAICGDYDADGMTSTALLLRALRILGATVNYTIPSRMSEGYGINQRIVEDCYAEGVQLILTVDNGIAALAPVQRARELGLAVIITDHHDLPPELPPANAILNPKLLPESSPYRGVAGVGVAYILAVCLAQALDQTQDLTAPLLELYTLGTIADLAPLTGVNRRWVRRGLALLPKSKILGIQALIQVAGLADQSKALKPEHIGFRLGPRINAVGRISDPQIVIDLLTTDDVGTALERAMQCEQINATRQDLCQKIEQEAIAWCEKQQEAGTVDLLTDRVLLVVQPNWHHGVIGIVASRLVERYGVPVFIGTYEDEEGTIIRGSARGIPEFDVFAALQHCAGVMEKFGGHRAAGGFSFRAEHLQVVKAKLVESACQQLTPDLLKPLIAVDAQARLSDITFDLYEQIDHLHPCGIENPDPVFWTPQVQVIDQQVVGRNRDHLKLLLGEGNGGKTIKAIAWRWGEYYPLPEQVDIAYKLKQNEWQGVTSVELELVGVRPSEPAFGYGSTGNASATHAVPSPAPKPDLRSAPIPSDPSSNPITSAANSTPTATAAIPTPLGSDRQPAAAASVSQPEPKSAPVLPNLPPAAPSRLPQANFPIPPAPAEPAPAAPRPAPTPSPNAIAFTFSHRSYWVMPSPDPQQFAIINPEGHELRVNLATGQGALEIAGEPSQALDIAAPRYVNLIQLGWQALELQRLTEVANSQTRQIEAQAQQLEAQAAQLAEQAWVVQAQEVQLAEQAKQLQAQEAQQAGRSQPVLAAQSEANPQALQVLEASWAERVKTLQQQLQQREADLAAQAQQVQQLEAETAQLTARIQQLQALPEIKPSHPQTQTLPQAPPQTALTPTMPVKLEEPQPRSRPNAQPAAALPSDLAEDLLQLTMPTLPIDPPGLDAKRLRQIRSALGDGVWSNLTAPTQQDIYEAFHQRETLTQLDGGAKDFSPAAAALVRAVRREILTPLQRGVAEYGQHTQDEAILALAIALEATDLHPLPALLAESWSALSDKALGAANKPRKALYHTVQAEAWLGDWAIGAEPVSDLHRALLDEFLQGWEHPLGRWIVNDNEAAAAGLAQIYQLHRVALQPDAAMPQWQYQLLHQMVVGDRRQVGLLPQILSEPSLFA